MVIILDVFEEGSGDDGEDVTSQYEVSYNTIHYTRTAAASRESSGTPHTLPNESLNPSACLRRAFCGTYMCCDLITCCTSPRSHEVEGEAWGCGGFPGRRHPMVVSGGGIYSVSVKLDAEGGGLLIDLQVCACRTCFSARLYIAV